MQLKKAGSLLIKLTTPLFFYDFLCILPFRRHMLTPMTGATSVSHPEKDPKPDKYQLRWVNPIIRNRA